MEVEDQLTALKVLESNEDIAKPDDGSYEHGKDRCPKTMLVGRRNGQLLFHPSSKFLGVVPD